MKKDNMDILLENALRPNLEPSKEINEKILGSIGHRRSNNMMFKLARVAAVIIAIICVGSIGVYAASQVIKKGFTTEHSISVGNPDYVDDAAIASPGDAVTIENVGHEEGDDSVNWITKDVQVVNGCATNTYYGYKDYETALLDSELANWFNTSYENPENVIYVVTETEDIVERAIDATFLYGEGSFSLHESIMTGNISGDAAYSIQLQNTNNKRNYTSKSGLEFTLVDEITNDGVGEEITTFVMIAYDDYSGYISFHNLNDDEIHMILDTVNIH